MKKKVVYLYVILSFMLFYTSCENRTPVARVENYQIYADDLKERIETSRTPSKTFRNIMHHTNAMVEDKLKYVDALQSNVDQDSVVLDRVTNYERGQVYSYLVNREIVDKIVSEKMIKNRYDLMSKEWHVRHILLPITADSMATIEKLKGIRSRILKGEDFGALAREFSQDIKSAGKNGDLGFLKYDLKKWDKRFLDTVASLRVDRVSDVIRTKQGYHLITVQRNRDVDLRPYGEEKSTIQNLLIRENVAELDNTFYQFRDEIGKKYNAEQIIDNIDSVLVLIKRVQAEHADEKVNLQRDPRQFISKLSEDERNFPLAMYDGGIYTLDELLTTYNQISPMRRPVFNDKPAVEEFLKRNVPRVLMIREGFRKGFDRKKEVKDAVDKERERQMVSRIERINIHDNTTPTDDEMMAIYEQNPHHYEKDARVKVQEIVVSSLDIAEHVHEKALAGDAFDVLAQQFNEREETKDENGVLGFIALRDYGAVSRAAVKLKTGEISEPIENRNRYSIVKILDRQDGELEPFEKVRSKIRRAERLRRRDALMDEWITALKEQYNIIIYEDVIKREFEITDEEN